MSTSRAVSVAHDALNSLAMAARRRRIHRLLLLAVAALLVLTGDAGAMSPAASPVSRAVVRIINRQGNELTIGSGALVEKRHDTGVVLTCAHLFSDGVGDLVVYFDGENPRPALLMAIDKQNDLASLVVARPAAASVAIAKTIPPPGSPLVSCGFGQEGKYRENHGALRGQVTLEHGQESGVLEVTGLARQGDSGGPIFDARHQVVGVIMGTDGTVVDGSHCGLIQRLLAAHPLTPQWSQRVTQLAARPVGDSLRALRPRYAEMDEADDAPLEVSAPVKVRGSVRYANQAVSGAKIHLHGPTSRVATLDAQGRFEFDQVAGGQHELKVDTIIHNTFRRAQHPLWIAPGSGEQEIELELK